MTITFFMVIDNFQGTILSNFWIAPMVIDDVTWISVEHYYQAMKTEDLNERREIYRAETPAAAKRLGKRCTIRPDWDDIKIDVMKKALRSKFDQHPTLRERLIATYPEELVEGNDWGDTFWGVDIYTKTGHNHLGKLLMQLRNIYRETTYTHLDDSHINKCPYCSQEIHIEVEKCPQCKKPLKYTRYLYFEPV